MGVGFPPNFVQQSSDFGAFRIDNSAELTTGQRQLALTPFAQEPDVGIANADKTGKITVTNLLRSAGEAPSEEAIVNHYLQRIDDGRTIQMLGYDTFSPFSELVKSIVTGIEAEWPNRKIVVIFDMPNPASGILTHELAKLKRGADFVRKLPESTPEQITTKKERLLEYHESYVKKLATALPFLSSNFGVTDPKSENKPSEESYQRFAALISQLVFRSNIEVEFIGTIAPGILSGSGVKEADGPILKDYRRLVNCQSKSGGLTCDHAADYNMLLTTHYINKYGGPASVLEAKPKSEDESLHTILADKPVFLLLTPITNARRDDKTLQLTNSEQSLIENESIDDSAKSKVRKKARILDFLRATAADDLTRSFAWALSKAYPEQLDTSAILTDVFGPVTALELDVKGNYDKAIYYEKSLEPFQIGPPRPLEPEPPQHRFPESIFIRQK